MLALEVLAKSLLGTAEPRLGNKCNSEDDWDKRWNIKFHKIEGQ